MPANRLSRLHTSSGTTGKPKAIFFSQRDVDQAADLVARCLVMVGATADDVLQNMMTYGLFTGALVVHYGAEKVGLLVIPAGPGNSERQILLMRDFGTTLFHCTPSYALYLADFMERQNIYPQQIERILMATPELGRNYLIELDGLDAMTVKVELSSAHFDGNVEHLVQLETRLADKLRAEILTKPKIQLVAPGSLPVSEGKAKRVIDRRIL